MGEVTQIFIATEKHGRLAQVKRAQLEAGKGIVGDRYYAESCALIENGKAVPDNHITFVASEELNTFLDKHNSDLKFGDFRRSVITKEADLNALVGKTFKVGDALCYGVELCEPCAFLAATVHRDVLPELVEKAGLRATILESGTVSTGSQLVEQP